MGTSRASKDLLAEVMGKTNKDRRWNTYKNNDLSKPMEPLLVNRHLPKPKPFKAPSYKGLKGVK